MDSSCGHSISFSAGINKLFHYHFSLTASTHLTDYTGAEGLHTNCREGESQSMNKKPR